MISGDKVLLSFSSRGIRLKLKGKDIEVSPRSLITEKMRKFIRDNKLLLVAALQNVQATQVVVCNDCVNFSPDTLGSGAGIGTCNFGIQQTQSGCGYMPLYRYANRRCDRFCKLIS